MGPDKFLVILIDRFHGWAHVREMKKKIRKSWKGVSILSLHPTAIVNTRAM